MLQHLLSEHGTTAADLVYLLGVHRAMGAMILRGERRLALSHVGKLVQHFGVAAHLFVG